MTSGIWKLNFWKGAAERAAATFAEAFGAILVADGTGLLDTDWTSSLSMSGMAALISLLKSVGGGVATRRSPGGARLSRYEVPSRVDRG